MKRMLLFVLITLLLAMDTGAGEIPASVKSKETIDRVRPKLKKKLIAKGLQWGAPVFMRIFKSQKSLQVWLHDGQRFKLFETFDICSYGQKGLGPKTKKGDGRAPEGFYYVTPLQLNPYSRYHLAFNLGYPNAYDRKHGWTGSALMVHGSCVSIGCFAMTDAQMDIIYALADAALRSGQRYFRVHIFPSEMTDQWMARWVDPVRTPHMAQWYGFWKELKKGYDYFERYRQPPNVQVENGCYLFSKAL